MPHNAHQEEMTGICKTMTISKVRGGGAAKHTSEHADSNGELENTPLLEALAEILRLPLPGGPERYMPEILRRLAKAVDASGVSLLRNVAGRTPSDPSQVEVACEWWAKDSFRAAVQFVPHLSEARRNLLQRNETLTLEFPETGIQSVLCIPIVAAQYWGFLTFVDCRSRRVWTDPQKAFLQVAGVGIGSVILRQGLERRSVGSEGAINQVPADSHQARLEELVKANEVLGRSIRNLVDIDNPDGFLREVLKTCAEVGGAVAAALFRYDQPSDSAFMEFWFEEGQFVDPASIPVFTRPFFSNVSGTDALRIIQSWWFNVEDLGMLPGVSEWHRQRGHEMIMHFPLKRGDERLGFVGVVFPTGISPTTNEIDILSALAQQATLALETKRLAAEAKQAAVALEREEAARRRAAALARANWAIRTSLDRLAERPHIDGFLGEVLSLCVEEFAAAAATVSLYDPAVEQSTLYLVCEDGVVKHASDGVSAK